MSERDFKIGTREFKLNKIDPFKQFHVVRRLGPILGDIIPVATKLQKMMKNTTMNDEQQFEAIAQIAGPVLGGFAKLSDADSEFILKNLCSAVEIHQQGAWGFIVRGDNFMIQDLELPVLLQVAGRSFIYNLTGFFAIAPQVSHGGQ